MSYQLRSRNHGIYNHSLCTQSISIPELQEERFSELINLWICIVENSIIITLLQFHSQELTTLLWQRIELYMVLLALFTHTLCILSDAWNEKYVSATKESKFVCLIFFITLTFGNCSLMMTWKGSHATYRTVSSCACLFCSLFCQHLNSVYWLHLFVLVGFICLDCQSLPFSPVSAF